MQSAAQSLHLARACPRQRVLRSNVVATCNAARPARPVHTQRRRAGFCVVAASAEKNDGQTVEFQGNILQDARAGQEGFSTLLKVETKSTSGDGAKEGDIVTIEYKSSFVDVKGEVSTVDADDDPNEPISFEVGAGDIMGNALFQAFDEAVRGMCVGDTAVVKAKAGDYDKELLFAVPRDHQEVQRLEADFGGEEGLKEGQIVTLSNGQVAILRQVKPEGVVIDCNHPLAGAPLQINLKMLKIDRPAAVESNIKG